MLRNRLLIALAGCLLAVSVASADDIGYVDCSKHGEETQVFTKPRRSQDTVATLACGERFTVLMYGFIFSRIETKSGQVGYIFSNLISVDASGATVQRRAPASPTPATSGAQTAGAMQPAAQPAAAPARAAETTSAAAQGKPANAQAQAAWTSEPTPVAASTVKAESQTSTEPKDASLRVAEARAASNVKPEPTAAATAPDSATPSATSTAAAQVAAPASTESVSPAAASSTEAQPSAPVTISAEPPAPAQPAAQPASPEPAAAEPHPPIKPEVRPANVREGWEKPIPSAAPRTPLMDFYGGYAFTRFNSGGTGTNLEGGMASAAWNVRPWLQIVADTSYSVVTLSGTKNILYGNHYGPRFFPRGRHRLGITPFAEALFGGSRVDTKVSGVGGYTVSDNSFSIKAGGGFDMRISRLFELRVADADYYRTSFGGVTQNNYWISTGIVLRLFGGASQ